MRIGKNSSLAFYDYNLDVIPQVNRLTDLGIVSSTNLDFTEYINSYILFYRDNSNIPRITILCICMRLFVFIFAISLFKPCAIAGAKYVICRPICL